MEIILKAVKYFLTQVILMVMAYYVMIESNVLTTTTFIVMLMVMAYVRAVKDNNKNEN